FAPTLLTQQSNLVSVALNPLSAPGGATDLAVPGNSFAGYSQSRAFTTTPIAAFRTEFENILTTRPNFTISADGSQPVDISLTTVLGAVAPAIAPGSAWGLAAMATRIEAVINAQLNAAVPGLAVTVAFQTAGNFSTLVITANSGDKKSVRITRAADPAKDFA